MKKRLQKPHRRSFESAPRVKRGEWVIFLRADPNNAAWFFGRDPHGTEGFFPQSWFPREGRQAVATRDYDATELTLEEGAAVEVLETLGGWCLVQDQQGRTGWIPTNCLP